MFDQVSSLYLSQKQRLERLSNRTTVLEVGHVSLNNQTGELRANASRMLVFAAANKAEILELKVVGTGLEDKLDRLYELHHLQTNRVTESAWLAEGNLTRLAGVANEMQDEIDTMTAR